MIDDIALPLLDEDRIVRISDYRGTRVLLIEFASW